MATNWKPDDSKLIGSKKESTNYIFLSDIYNNPHGSSYGTWANLFDGKDMGVYAGQHDMKIQFNTYVNIYGISTYNVGKSDMDINDENKNSLNYKYKTNYTNCNSKWELIFKNVAPGIYIFNSKLPYSSRETLMSEWFIEQAFDNKYLIRMDNKFYCLKSDTYDVIGKRYTEIYVTPDNALTDLFLNNEVILPDLSKEVTFNSETFKPITKFENFSIKKINFIE